MTYARGGGRFNLKAEKPKGPEWAALYAHPQFRECIHNSENLVQGRGEVQTPAPSYQDRAG